MPASAKVSRQVKYQRKQRAQGCCVQCGMPAHRKFLAGEWRVLARCMRHQREMREKNRAAYQEKMKAKRQKVKKRA